MEGPFPPFQTDSKPKRQTKAKPAGATRIRDIPIKAVFPNLLTLLAICSGLTSIRFAVEDRFELAIGAIVLAAILDALDGRVARFLKSTSEFGAQMDSLADFVNFGVAPVMLLYFWTLSDASSFGWISVLIYAIGASLRLARFNVTSEEPSTPRWQKNYFTGVPAPAAALIVLLPVYLGEMGLQFVRSMPHAIAVFTLIVGVLMISNLPTWSGKDMGKRIRRDLVFPMMIGGVLLVALLLSYPWQALAIASSAYLIGLPFGAARWHKLNDQYQANRSNRAKSTGKVPKTKPEENDANASCKTSE